MSRDKHNKAVIFIGWINRHGAANCGETMKNQLLIERLRQLGVKCHLADFYRWRRHPWVFLQLLFYVVFYPKAAILFSTSTVNIYPMMKLIKKFHWHRHIIHWVIGGSLGEKTKKGEFSPDVLNVASFTLVESDKMKNDLNEVGVKNVIKVTNFKPIFYLPKIQQRKANAKKRFVFLSRIMPEKGCDYILAAVKRLDESGYTGFFEVDFYGKIDSQYKPQFLSAVDKLENVTYRGFLNLHDSSGYDTLASYDALLFSTYWIGEGFAGIFCDAFIAGLPILASDWAHNKYFLTEGKTAIFHPVHNVDALTRDMLRVINNDIDLNQMRKECQAETTRYDINNVVTERLLHQIGLI